MRLDHIYCLTALGAFRMEPLNEFIAAQYIGLTVEVREGGVEGPFG
jgi:hypothetical protein